jgi:hypothetical protein
MEDLAKYKDKGIEKQMKAALRLRYAIDFDSPGRMRQQSTET